MPLKLVSLLPHSPLLIPEIGQANYNLLAKTNKAYNYLEQKIEEQTINTLIIVSPHGKAKKHAFTINVAPEMLINLKDFGFIPPKTVITGDALLADNIQANLRPEWNLELISENILDNGSAVPLYLLQTHNPKLKTVIIYPPEESERIELINFGQKLGKILNKDEQNIALIASGDLSHRLKKKSPAGYSPKGAKFDNKLIEYLSDSSNAIDNILQIDQNLITAASECGLKPLLIILGAIKDKNWTAKILAYQTDFGVGYLSLDFLI